MRKIASLLTMLMLLCAFAFGQSRTITGRVTNENGDAVAFATVREAGNLKNSVSADANGNFLIKVKEGSKITISSSGFSEITIDAPASGFVTAALKSTGTLSEVTVVTTSLGQVRQAKELGFSTAKVKATELTQARPVNLQNGLTGKVSGLNIQTVNNGVFADTRITLRGLRSLTGNNQPMLIVDGVPISLGYISTLNPNDVADVTVLKSSSATAIYGPEGVNGAIVITTKRGSKSKPTVTVSHTFQAERISFMPKFQTSFGSGSSIDQYGYGVYDPIENQCYGPQFDGSIVPIGRPLKNASGGFDTLFTTYSAKPDEKRKFFNTGFTNQSDVSFSTGDFYLSAQNVSIRGIVPKDENNRRSIRMRAEKEYNRFKASFNFNYVNSNYDVTTSDAYWFVFNTPMQIPLTQFKDWRNNKWANPNGYFSDYYPNPYFTIDNERARGRGDDVLGNVELNFKATSWLSFTYRLGGTFSAASNKNIRNQFLYSAETKASGKYIAGTDVTATVSDGESTTRRITSEFFATVRKNVKNFNFEGLLGQSFREIATKSIGVSTANLGIPQVFNVSVRRGEPGASEANSLQRLQRFFGKVGVGYKDWAFAEATGSYDMDSRLANPYNYNVKNISFFYPGANVSVVLSNAIGALKNSSTISFAKVRAAVSKTGNVNLGTYQLQNPFNTSSGFPFGTLLGFTADNTLRASSYEPEFVVNKEVGIELGFLKNRINIEASAYQQDNSNQIITVAYSAATGFPSSLLNAASFKNKGIDLDLKLTPLVKLGQLSVDFKVNYSYNTNKVYKLIEGVDELGIGNGNYVIKGMPAYTFKLTDYVRDSLGRVVVDPVTGYPSADPNLKVFGQTIPKHQLGINLNLNWKNLTVSAVADYRGGAQMYSGIGADMDFTGISYRSGQHGRQPFIFPNSSYFDGSKYVANTSIYTQNGGYGFWESSANNRSINSNYLSSADFWKLREVSVSYTIPSSIVNKTKIIKGATVSISGRNLFTWLPKSNQWTDPEFSGTTGNAQGVNSTFNTPPTRIFGANITLQL